MADNSQSDGPSDPAGEGFGPPPLPGSVPPPLPGAGQSPSRAEPAHAAEPPHFEFTQPSAAARPHGSEQGPPPFGNYLEPGTGETLSAAVAQPPTTVTKDVPCGGCGYPVRGLPTDGMCPECGKPVIESLRGDGLQFADATWLSTIAKGLKLAWIFVIVSAVLQFVSFIGAIALGLSGSADPATIAVTFGMLEMAAALPGLYAWWLITEPEPSEQPTNPIRKRRRTLRALVVIDVGAKLLKASIALLLTAAGGQAGMRSFLRPSSVTGGGGVGPASVTDAFTTLLASASIAANVIEYITYVLAFIFGCLYLRRLALRAGDIDTASFAKTTATVAPICVVLLGCLGGIGFLIALVLWIILLARTQGMVRKCIDWQLRWQAELAAYKARTAPQA